ncbi:helix-turn-helix transcriptional regulator [Pediococcus ethanolidurans]|uniref:helix-turn-helix transcriptional regulator n=1 Tax=Pediococcus ethanolidurans TaxID=319653 RepID=UPI0021E892C4|nr:helix-turn-helix transcriptional regulator [Pediococcus ethanolidurans]MCV3315652.1 helix-turn-helix transcriptional regulator [Pediococcus ethanolidurans]
MKNNLRLILAERHMPVCRLAKEINVKPRRLYRITRWQCKRIKPKLLLKIMGYLEITASEFFGG